MSIPEQKPSSVSFVTNANLLFSSLERTTGHGQSKHMGGFHRNMRVPTHLQVTLGDLEHPPCSKTAIWHSLMRVARTHLITEMQILQLFCCSFLRSRGSPSEGTTLPEALVAHDCGYPLSRYTCRATRVAADFLDLIAFCRCSTGVALHPLRILVSHLSPPPIPGRCRTEIWV